MEQKIRHRRLQAFYTSKVLNSLFIVMLVSLFLMDYMKVLLLPAICGSMAMAFFIGYTLWFWIKKPKQIIINNWMSDMNTWFLLYFLIISAMRPVNPWWYMTPVILATILLCISLITHHDETFQI